MTTPSPKMVLELKWLCSLNVQENSLKIIFVGECSIKLMCFIPYSLTKEKCTTQALTAAGSGRLIKFLHASCYPPPCLSVWVVATTLQLVRGQKRGETQANIKHIWLVACVIKTCCPLGLDLCNAFLLPFKLFSALVQESFGAVVYCERVLTFLSLVKSWQYFAHWDWYACLMQLNDMSLSIVHLSCFACTTRHEYQN